MNRPILLASLLTLTLWPIAAVQAQVPTVKPLPFPELQLSQGNVRVTVVESAVVFYAAKVPATTLVFVIEHLGEQAITTSSSNVSFLNADREKIVTAVPDDEQMRVSGSVVYDFHDYRQDRRKFFPDIALPEPEQPERSWVNLQWFREPVPEQAAFLEVVFSGERFTLRLKKQRWRRTCSTRILSSDRSVSIPQRQLRLEHLMVDIGTWNRLNPEAQQEFRELRERFQLELQRRGITDGLDFAQLWQVQPVEGCWMIGNGTDVLEGIASSRQEVIKALFADAVQNLNR